MNLLVHKVKHEMESLVQGRKGLFTGKFVVSGEGIASPLTFIGIIVFRLYLKTCRSAVVKPSSICLRKHHYSSLSSIMQNPLSWVS